MVACMGFANLFGKIGLLPTSTQDRSLFSGISTTSGASWFSTQLFYSPQFYDGVVNAANSTELYDFVVLWMEAYHDVSVKFLQEQRDKISPEEVERSCNFTALGGGEWIDVLNDLCGTLLYFEGDWAKLVDIMLQATSAAYGDDDLASRKVRSYNRVPELSDTDLIIQSAFVPNSRIRSSDPNEESDTAVYFGPDFISDDDFLYTVPLSAAYVIDDSSSYFAFSTHEAYYPFDAFIGSTPKEHSFSDWDAFYLYPGTNGTHYIESGNVFESNNTDKYELEEPFVGAPSVTQIAAISSAAAGAFSPLVHSVFTQGLSKQRHDIITDDDGTSGLRAFERTVKQLYSNSLFDNFAVCSSWPVPRGLKDGHFIDGAFVDNPSLAMNLGQFYSSDGWWRKTIKVVLTNTNQNADTKYTSILQYFDSPLNEGVPPGRFNWPPKVFAPHQSTQIFQEYMDRTILEGCITQIEGSNMSTAILKGTTVTNPDFDIVGGQKVEVFLINLNQDITTYIVTPTVIKYFTEPLAGMAQHIADNQELKRRLQDFFHLKDDEDSNVETSGDSPSSTASRLAVWLAVQTVLILSLCMSFLCSYK